MKRREFITLVGGVAGAWSVLARAQQPEPMRRIGVLMNLASADPEGQVRLKVFLQALEKQGWADGRNLHIDTCWGAGRAERYRTCAAELIGHAPDVILAGSGSAMPALMDATRSLPIVLVQTVDPVGSGYVASLAKPEGNATGFTQFEYSMGGKWLELLKQIAPNLKRVAVLRDSATGEGPAQFAAIQFAAPGLGVEINSDRRPRRRRDRARDNSLLGKAGRRIDSHSKRLHRGQPRRDHCPGGAVPLAGGLPFSVPRSEWRSHHLRAGAA